MHFGFGAAFVGEVGNGVGVSPALALTFAGADTLDPRVTFTRADSVTCATYFDSTGRLQTNGVNLALWSQQFTNAVWTPASTNVTRTDNYATAPDGTQTAARLQVTVANGGLRQNLGSINTNYRQSIWVKSNTGSNQQCQFWQGTATGISSTFTATSSWQRIDAPMNDNTTARFDFGSNTTADLLIWGAQFEGGTAATTYALTTSAANSGPRFDYDPSVPAGVTGGELYPAFSAVSSVGAGWSVSGSTLVASSSSSIFTDTTNYASYVTGKTYQITVVVSSRSAGVFHLYLRGNQVALNISAAGTYTYYGVAGTLTGEGLSILGVGGFTGVISSTSVKEVTFTPRGLLIEESRTNLLLQSRDMAQAVWGKDFSTAARNQVGVDGVSNTACKITPDTSSNIHRVSQGTTIVTATAYTYSVIAKAAGYNFLYINGAAGPNLGQVCFNLSTGTIAATSNGTGTITNLGGGWYRCSVTATSAGTTSQPYCQVNNSGVATDTTFVGDGTSGIILDMAQQEAGSFPTSPIPTTSAALTRAADSASMTGTNFSSWYAGAAGTFYAEYVTPFATGSSGVIVSNGGGSREWMYGGSTGSANNAARTIDNTNGALNSTNSTITAGGVVKGCMAYGAGTRAITANGNTPNTGAYDGIFSTATQLSIGVNGSVSTILNGWIRRVTFYPTKLSTAQMSALTT